MNPLRELQSDFQSFLLHGGERMLGRVTGTARAGVQTRLGIYYDAYRLRLLEALDANYPVLHAWLGDEEFEKLGLAYLVTHPSAHFSIRYFGHRLPEYLATAPDYRDKPYVAEMAAMEWAMSEAFDAADVPVLSADDVAAVPPDGWPTMRFQFHSSARRLNLRWNVPAIWKAIRQNIEAEESGAEPLTDVPAPAAGDYPQSWLVWRRDLKTNFRSLPVNEAWALDSALSSGSFAVICEGLTEWIDAQNIAVHAAGLLKKWLFDGLLSGLVIEGK